MLVGRLQANEMMVYRCHRSLWVPGENSFVDFTMCIQKKLSGALGTFSGKRLAGARLDILSKNASYGVREEGQGGIGGGPEQRLVELPISLIPRCLILR
ncbi:hypothetical protein StoSoilB5_26710 [Arthrobacter sp. StoSoilB5]|nr:hypothetical protein StoSoilB5_26710 [Arthrobacter sp. StoSoilB5]